MSEPKAKAVHQSEIPAEVVQDEGALGVTIQWLIAGRDGAPNFYMRRFTVAPGGFTPKHSHAHEHEVYCLAGRGEVLIGDKWRPFEKDFVIFVPPWVEHQFKNTGDEDLVFLCLVPAK